MNPITVFLTLACIAAGVAFGATGHLYWGIPFVIAAIVIASALKMANTWEKFALGRNPPLEQQMDLCQLVTAPSDGRFGKARGPAVLTIDFGCEVHR